MTRPRPGRTGVRKATLRPDTARQYGNIVARYRRWAAANGRDPDRPTARDVRDWTAANAHVQPDGLTGYVNALKRWQRDNRTDDPAVWKPATDLIRTLRRTQPPGSSPPPPDPLLRSDLRRLAKTSHTGHNAHPAHIARGRSALVAVHAGHDLDTLAWTAPPAPDAVTGPARLPVTAGRNRPARTAVLTDVPASPNLPSPAAAARDLARLLPPGAFYLYAVTAGNDHPHDQPPRPAVPGSTTVRRTEHQLAAAARRANVPWPNAAEGARMLTPDQLELVYLLVDPNVLTDAADRAERALNHHTALRGINVHAFTTRHARRNDQTGPGAAWTFTVDQTKTADQDGHRIVVGRHPDPSVDPVAALDLLAALRAAVGRTRGPFLPATDVAGAFTDRHRIRPTTNNALGRAAAAAGIPKKFTSRSLRIGGATQTYNDGGTLTDVERLTRNSPKNAGRYLRGVPPHTLRL